MSNPKVEAVAAISRAQTDLDAALAELDRLPALDAQSIALSAHALNNFLTVLMAVIDLLLKELRDHPEPRVRIWLEGLSHTSNLMTHTVSQLMNNSAAPAVRPRLEDVELPTLVAYACAYYRRAAEAKGIRLTFDVGRDVPSVRTDRVLVAAILDNLLSNAVKYSPHDKRVWLLVDGVGDGVLCSVRDEGPGLSKSEQAQLFVPGARLGPVPSGGETSSGYGLSIAKRFVEQLGGEIRCASAPGEGATFSFWLPSHAPDDV